MWKQPKEDMLCFLYFEKENIVIIKIYKNIHSHLSYDYLIQDNYYAYVIDPYKLRHHKVSDNTLDILKTKCLIKAKEVGWNISKIII